MESLDFRLWNISNPINQVGSMTRCEKRNNSKELITWKQFRLLAVNLLNDLTEKHLSIINNGNCKIFGQFRQKTHSKKL